MDKVQKSKSASQNPSQLPLSSGNVFSMAVAMHAGMILCRFFSLKPMCPTSKLSVACQTPSSREQDDIMSQK